MKLTSEEWKPVPSLPFYEASSKGRIRSIDREVVCYDTRWKNWRTVRYKSKIVKTQSAPGNTALSYPRFKAVKSIGVYETVLVHRCVCEAFHGPCPKGMEVCHRDDNKRNNHKDNLYWGSHGHNMKEAAASGAFIRGWEKRRAA